MAPFVSIKDQSGVWPAGTESGLFHSRSVASCLTVRRDARVLDSICSALCAPSTPATVSSKTRADLSTCWDHVWERLSDSSPKMQIWCDGSEDGSVSENPNKDRSTRVCECVCVRVRASVCPWGGSENRICREIVNSGWM